MYCIYDVKVTTILGCYIEALYREEVTIFYSLIKGLIVDKPSSRNFMLQI